MPSSMPVRCESSECLPDRNEELKFADALYRLDRAVVDQIQVRPFQTIECRRIQTVSQIQTHRPNGRAIPDAEPDGLHHVVEVLQVALVKAERDAAQVRIDIAHVMDQHTMDVIADQREMKLGGVEQQGIASYGKSGFQVAGTGLIVGKAAVRTGAAAVEAFR